MSLTLASGSCWIPTTPSCYVSCSSLVAPVGIQSAPAIFKHRYIYCNTQPVRFPSSSNYLASTSTSTSRFHSKLLVAAVAEYKFPDPIPEFADDETEKLKSHLLQKLSKKGDIYGDSLPQVVDICIEIFHNFLNTEYGGPGTLLVLPFIDMNDAINERGLPGGPKAAEAAVKWARKYVDNDWEKWTSKKDFSS